MLSKYLPQPFKGDRRPLWTREDRIKTVPWADFFKIEKNRMITYRITPHAGVTSNNRRLWRAIYQMYNIYNNPISRMERDGFKFRYRERDSLWFDIVFRQHEGNRAIEFYLTTTEFQAEKLKRKIENKMDVTISEAEAAALHVPKENTIVQELRYLRHDVFSLNTNASETKTPIASILNTVDELQHDGDFARLSMCAVVENRQKWIGSASWAMEKMAKNQVPQRANIDPRKLVKTGRVVLAGVLNHINDAANELYQAVHDAVFKSDKKLEKTKIIDKAYSIEDEIGSRRLAGASLEKINLPVFKTYYRIAAHSHDRLTREMMADTMGLATTELAENNELQAVRVRIGSRRYEIIEELNTFRLSNRSRLNGDVNRMSTDEMAKLALQMPNAELQRRYDAELQTKRKIETSIPAAMRQDVGIYLGEAEIKDQSIPIRMPLHNPDEFYRGYVFIGGQGAGKDTAIKNWIVEGCIEHGISAIIPEVIVEEGERGMADGIRDSLPPDKVIDLDFGNDEYSIPLDLTEVLAKLGRIGASRFADEIVDFLDMGQLTRAKHILKVVAKASGGSLREIKRIIEDEQHRESVAQALIDDGNIRLATDLVNLAQSQDALHAAAEPILNRLGDFFDNDKLYDVFAQSPHPDVNFSRWMQEGKVVICRIPSRRLGPAAARILVHWLTLKIVMTRMLMTKQEQENGCMIVYNEPEQYATEGLTNLMGRIGTEFRKERMGSMYAFHHWNKLPQRLQENLQGGGVQQFLFANDHLKTFELSKHRLEPTILVEEAARLPVHHAIVSVRVGGALQDAFVCHMAAPVSKRFQQYDNSFLTLRHARMYGRSWEELQRAI